VSEQPAGPEQLHLFTSRYSLATIAIMLRLPEANARCFYIASALGRTLDEHGGFTSLKTSANGGGVFIGPVHRMRFLKIANVGQRRWRALVTDWERRYVAHRCYPDGVTLFTRPLDDLACPKCKADILMDEWPPSPAARRHPNAPKSAAKAELTVPQSGTNSSAWGEPTVPPTGTETTPPRWGFNKGKK